MKPSSAVLVSLILVSDIFASTSFWKGKTKAKPQVNLIPSNLHVRCGIAEYSPEEIDKAARDACYLKLSSKKLLGLPLSPQPKAYKGNKVIIVDENSRSPNHHSRQGFDHTTHILQFGKRPFLMWDLENKLLRSKAKCYAIIEWSPERLKCKAIAVVVRRPGKDDLKCEEDIIPDSTSRHAGSPIYNPKSPSIIPDSTSRHAGSPIYNPKSPSPPRPQIPIPVGDMTPSPGRRTPFVSDLAPIEENKVLS